MNKTPNRYNLRSKGIEVMQIENSYADSPCQIENGKIRKRNSKYQWPF